MNKMMYVLVCVIVSRDHSILVEYLLCMLVVYKSIMSYIFPLSVFIKLACLWFKNYLLMVSFILRISVCTTHLANPSSRLKILFSYWWLSSKIRPVSPWHQEKKVSQGVSDILCSCHPLRCSLVLYLWICVHELKRSAAALSDESCCSVFIILPVTHKLPRFHPLNTCQPSLTHTSVMQVCQGDTRTVQLQDADASMSSVWIFPKSRCRMNPQQRGVSEQVCQVRGWGIRHLGGEFVIVSARTLVSSIRI